VRCMEKAKKKLLAFLKTGITPEQLAFCIALGVILGMVPALGMATVFCTLAAFLFRLNLAAIQLVNFFMYPVQLALLIPFMRAGEWLFGARPLELSLDKIRGMLKEDLWGTVFHLWATTLRAVVVWMIIAPVVLGVLYLIFLPLLRKLKVERITAGAVDSVDN
jgi:uncharacterized protein (DUF2062 family)